MKLYMVLSLVGNLFREEMFSVMTEFLGKVVGWTVKTMFGIVVGFHLIQGLVLPQADAMKNAAVVRTIEAVPGIGAGAGAMSNLLMGSAVLIKNTAGCRGSGGPDLSGVGTYGEAGGAHGALLSGSGCDAACM